MKILVETTVQGSLHEVWTTWITPADIEQWNFASDDWHCPKAFVDLRAGGTFKYRMEAKDGSTGFDFMGTYTHVEPFASLVYDIEDGRRVEIGFQEVDSGIKVVELFEAEDIHSIDDQKEGWQSILNNFKYYCEQKYGQREP